MNRVNGLVCVDRPCPPLAPPPNRARAKLGVTNVALAFEAANTSLVPLQVHAGASPSESVSEPSPHQVGDSRCRGALIEPPVHAQIDGAIPLRLSVATCIRVGSSSCPLPSTAFDLSPRSPPAACASACASLRGSASLSSDAETHHPSSRDNLNLNLKLLPPIIRHLQAGTDTGPVLHGTTLASVGSSSSSSHPTPTRSHCQWPVPLPVPVVSGTDTLYTPYSDDTPKATEAGTIDTSAASDQIARASLRTSLTRNNSRVAVFSGVQASAGTSGGDIRLADALQPAALNDSEWHLQVARASEGTSRAEAAALAVRTSLGATAGLRSADSGARNSGLLVGRSAFVNALTSSLRGTATGISLPAIVRESLLHDTTTGSQNPSPCPQSTDSQASSSSPRVCAVTASASGGSSVSTVFPPLVYNYLKGHVLPCLALNPECQWVAAPEPSREFCASASASGSTTSMSSLSVDSSSLVASPPSQCRTVATGQSPAAVHRRLVMRPPNGSPIACVASVEPVSISTSMSCALPLPVGSRPSCAFTQASCVRPGAASAASALCKHSANTLQNSASVSGSQAAGSEPEHDVSVGLSPQALHLSLSTATSDTRSQSIASSTASGCCHTLSGGHSDSAFLTVSASESASVTSQVTVSAPASASKSRIAAVATTERTPKLALGPGCELRLSLTVDTSVSAASVHCQCLPVHPSSSITPSQAGVPSPLEPDRLHATTATVPAPLPVLPEATLRLALASNALGPVEPVGFTPEHWSKVSKLGEGSFGQVFLCVNSATGNECALKEVSLVPMGWEGVVTVSDKSTKLAVRALMREVEVLAMLSHPNVVHYLAAIELPHGISLFMEYVRGESLRAHLDRSASGCLADAVTKEYVRQLLHGLVYLHDKKVVHGDLKCATLSLALDARRVIVLDSELVESANIMVVEGTDVVKLVDFGCSWVLPADCTPTRRSHAQTRGSARSVTRPLEGTVPFMAPEVVRQACFGRKADIWSLGCVVLEMASGQAPFAEMHFSNKLSTLYHIATSPHGPAIPPHLSPLSAAFVRRCLQVDPALRPSATQLLQDDWMRGSADSADSRS